MHEFALFGFNISFYSSTGSITDDGDDLIEKIMPEHQELVDYMLGSLNDDEADLLVKFLNKIRKRVAS